MKKILIAVILMTCGTMLANAQFTKGNVMVGVSSSLSLLGTGSDLMTIGFSNVKSIESYDDGQIVYTNETDSKTSSFNILPRGAIFVTNNIAVGTGVNYGRSVNKQDIDGEFKRIQKIISMEPFVRYYYPISSVTVFAEFNGSLGSIKVKSEYDGNSDEDPDKSKLSSIGGGVGVAIPIGSKATFDVMTNYNALKITEEDDIYSYETKVGTFGVKFGFKVYFGGFLPSSSGY